MLIVGDKAARHARGESTFHLVERGFGRFARTVRIACSCDPANARATLSNDGELRISVRSDRVLFVERAKELAVWGLVKGFKPEAVAKASLNRAFMVSHTRPETG